MYFQWLQYLHNFLKCWSRLTPAIKLTKYQALQPCNTSNKILTSLTMQMSEHNKKAFLLFIFSSFFSFSNSSGFVFCAQEVHVEEEISLHRAFVSCYGLLWCKNSACLSSSKTPDCFLCWQFSHSSTGKYRHWGLSERIAGRSDLTDVFIWYTKIPQARRCRAF